MSVSALSESNQNYLKAVWSLGEWSNDPITSKHIAEQVGVRISTASDAIKKLASQGLVDHTPYGAVTLTSEGRSHAVQMIRRHRLIESFLVDVLGYRWDQVHDEAEVLEHAVSDFMVDRIDQHLGYPDRDPHGDPIPRADGTIHRPAAVLLGHVGAGENVHVERISDSDPELLQFFAHHGIRFGTELRTLPPAPFSETVHVEVAGGGPVLPLGRAAAEAVWVRPSRPGDDDGEPEPIA